MKKRPLDTTSERQLLCALLASGRKAGLAELRAWRKAGLLPPLASHGIGAGRSYYWREPDILAQAERVHDALQRHGRIDEALITVWLAGFDVPLERVRRAWLNRAKMSARHKRRGPAHASATSLDSGNLLGLGFATLVSLVDPDPRHKRMVLEILSGASTDGMASRRHLLGMAMVYGPLLENSNLMAMATEDEFPGRAAICAACCASPVLRSWMPAARPPVICSCSFWDWSAPARLRPLSRRTTITRKAAARSTCPLPRFIELPVLEA